MNSQFQNWMHSVMVKHVKPSDMKEKTDWNGLCSTIFHLLQIKSTVYDEDVSWSVQAGSTDPEVALKNHLTINLPPSNSPLFAYQHKKEHHSLTKPAFIKALAGSKSYRFRPTIRAWYTYQIHSEISPSRCFFWCYESKRLLDKWHIS